MHRRLLRVNMRAWFAPESASTVTVTDRFGLRSQWISSDLSRTVVYVLKATGYKSHFYVGRTSDVPARTRFADGMFFHESGPLSGWQLGHILRNLNGTTQLRTAQR